jgi:hypothetical protein
MLNVLAMPLSPRGAPYSLRKKASTVVEAW